MTSIVVGKDRISLLESERYIAGTKNVYVMKVAFSEDWDGLEKKIVFKTDCFQQTVELISCSEQFPIPSEVFARPTNKLQVGAYGYQCDELALNTRWLSLGRVQKGTVEPNCGCPPHHPPIKPSPNTYEALRSMIERKADRLTFEDGQFMLWAGDDLLSSFDPPVCLPDGGSIDQVLAKASERDGDFKWMTISSTTTASYKVPVGTIQIWSGSLDNIPDSYSLCDGQNGTPDLRSAMIVGASEFIEPGAVSHAPEENEPMPLSEIKRDPTTIRYYALAFVQKTSLTEADKKEGQTAYELAVQQGFEGTLEEWLESLKGEDGKSAYEIAVANGYTGTIEEFAQNLAMNADHVVKDLRITSKEELSGEGFGSFYFENVQFQPKTRGAALQLNQMIAHINTMDPTKIIVTTLDNRCYEMPLDDKGYILSVEEVEGGTDGKSAYQIAVDNGFSGTEAEWLESLKGAPGTNGENGADGKSAYQIALENGFDGTEAEWLESLKGAAGKNGENGSDGKSAYELAVQQGFEGTLDEWLESLKGEKGDTVTGDGEVIEGPAGKDGKSAYEVAVSNGFSGTEEEWLASLKGSAGLSAYQVAKANGFEGTETEWVESLKGVTGASGENGASAYDIAVENGFTGTEAEWLESLKGENGKDGQNGSDGAPGTNGENGSDGKSAYDIAVEEGYQGTKSEWLASLKGEDGSDGKSAYQIAVDNGYTGTEAEWLASLKGSDGTPGTNGENGSDGKSAYQIAVDNGFVGTEAEWLESLKGSSSDAAGTPGKSAYELAVQQGFEGTLDEWLESLKGEDGVGIPGVNGASAYQIALNNGFEGTEEEWLASLKGATGARGKSAYQLAVDAGYEGDEASWLASLKGGKGDPGKDGADGKSAYEIAVEEGFEGSVDEWLESVQNGKSAYELAVEQGYEGTLQQWLDSLKGEGIEEFLTYANITITSKDQFVSVGATRTVHFQNCTIAAADGNSVHFADELVDVTQYGTIYELYRLNNETVVVGFGDDEVFDTLEIKAIETPKSTLIVEFPLENPPIVGAMYILAPEDFNREPIDGERLYGIVTVTGNSKTLYYVTGSVTSASYKRVIFDQVVQLGGNAENGKSAYEIAVDNGFEGTEVEWLESLKGQKGDSGASIQKLDDLMHMGEYVVGRWKDGRPLYRFDYMEEDMHTTLSMASPGASNCHEISSFPNVDVVDIRGWFSYYSNGEPIDKYFFPYVLNGAHFELMWRGDEQNVVLRFEPINSSTESAALDGDLLFSIWYVRNSDDEMDDSDLIISGDGGGGTIDHRELTHRDSISQHPIAAISGLSDRLAAAPAQTITDEQINTLFNN